MLVKDLIALYNVKALTTYNKSYQEMEPEFKQIGFEYESGLVASVDFPFVEFLKGMEEFTGQRQHQTFPQGFKFTVTNKEYDMSVDIARKDIERASNAASVDSAFAGLNLFTLRISEMAKQAKDHPYELMFDMLEVGDANTYGTCFDGQNLFDTTHSYKNIAGTQNNIVTGTCGTNGSLYTSASLHADILKVMNAFSSFYYEQGGTGNAKLRKLNAKGGKILIVAPVEMEGVLFSLQQSEYISSGVSNAVRNSFTYVTRKFTDTSDWYAIYIDGDTMFRPFLYQKELAPELDMPSVSDESAKENKKFTYGAYGRYGVAYGAWWKCVMVQNS